jgi:hypothetical protein
MTPNSKPPDNPTVPYTAIGQKFVTVGGEVGCLTLVIVLAAVFGGIWLDRVLGTQPFFTVLFVLGSAPLALVLTFWVARRAVKDINLPPQAGGKTNMTEGEKSSD